MEDDDGVVTGDGTFRPSMDGALARRNPLSRGDRSHLIVWQVSLGD
jgi:hypothetical protein